MGCVEVSFAFRYIIDLSPVATYMHLASHATWRSMVYWSIQWWEISFVLSPWGHLGEFLSADQCPHWTLSLKFQTIELYLIILMITSCHFLRLTDHPLIGRISCFDAAMTVYALFRVKYFLNVRVYWFRLVASRLCSNGLKISSLFYQIFQIKETQAGMTICAFSAIIARNTSFW